jgi:peptidoglycan/xylan/chitin deacetylase (PgdA/CDA1 family)
MSPSARDAATAALRARVGDGDDRPIGAEGIAALRAAGHDVGFHTRRHDDLCGLADRELATAMAVGRAALERAAGSSTSAIAYPHGSADARVAAAARAAGFATGFTTDPAPVTRGTDPLLLGRVYPAAGAQGRFALELSRTLSRALRVTGA